MATRTVVGSTPTPSHPCKAFANTPAAATVGTHPKEAHELALQACLRIEGMANVLRRELENAGCDFAFERLIRDVIELNSVVMTVLDADAIAKLSDLALIVGVEVNASQAASAGRNASSVEEAGGAADSTTSERIGEAISALHDAAALVESIAKDQAPNVGHTMRMARLAADIVDRTINDLDRLDMEAAHG